MDLDFSPGLRPGSSYTLALTDSCLLAGSTNAEDEPLNAVSIRDCGEVKALSAS